MFGSYHQSGETDDRIQGSTNFMAHISKECRFQTVGFLRFGTGINQCRLCFDKFCHIAAHTKQILIAQRTNPVFVVAHLSMKHQRMTCRMRFSGTNYLIHISTDPMIRLSRYHILQVGVQQLFIRNTFHMIGVRSRY